jgi:hypothetical protein
VRTFSGTAPVADRPGRPRRTRWRARFTWRRRPTPPDPFEALGLQLRLGTVADQLRHLETDERVWARGRRWIATQDAYDALLADACRMAGLEHPEPAPRTEDERLGCELALSERGWSW